MERYHLRRPRTTRPLPSGASFLQKPTPMSPPPPLPAAAEPREPRTPPYAHIRVLGMMGAIVSNFPASLSAISGNLPPPPKKGIGDSMVPLLGHKECKSHPPMVLNNAGSKIQEGGVSARCLLARVCGYSSSMLDQRCTKSFSSGWAREIICLDQPNHQLPAGPIFKAAGDLSKGALSGFVFQRSQRSSG